MASAPIRFVILDQDDVLFQHWPGLAHTMHNRIYEVLVTHMIAKGLEINEAAIRKEMREAYREEGFDNVRLARTHGLDRHIMHQEYHRIFLDNDVIPVFQDSIKPLQNYYDDLRTLIGEMHEQGIRFGVLTHGNEDWAREIAPLLQLDALIPFRRGIDSYAFRLKHTHDCLFCDFLRDAGYDGPMESVALLDDRRENLHQAEKIGIRTFWIDTPADSDVADAAPFRAEKTLSILRGLLAEAKKNPA